MRLLYLELYLEMSRDDHTIDSENSQYTDFSILYIKATVSVCLSRQFPGIARIDRQIDTRETRLISTQLFVHPSVRPCDRAFRPANNLCDVDSATPQK